MLDIFALFYSLPLLFLDAITIFHFDTILVLPALPKRVCFGLSNHIKIRIRTCDRKWHRSMIHLRPLMYAYGATRPLRNSRCIIQTGVLDKEARVDLEARDPVCL
jgi:hypothetical protein